MTVVIVLVVLLVLLVLAGVVLYNRLIRLRNESDQGFAGIDVQLKRRADLIPNLVTTVQAYASHEKAVFDEVTRARAQTLQAQSLPEKAMADGVMQSALTGLLGVAEAYPDLKAVASFKALQDELVDTEDKIAAARRYYNTVVQQFNTGQQTFPASLVAGTFGFSPREFFRLEDDGDRAPVAVSL
jgi:LemA protein